MPKASGKIKTTKINGKEFVLQYRDKDGSIKDSPKGKYVNSFGDLKSLPKEKKK